MIGEKRLKVFRTTVNLIALFKTAPYYWDETTQSIRRTKETLHLILWLCVCLIQITYFIYMITVLIVYWKNVGIVSKVSSDGICCIPWTRVIISGLCYPQVWCNRRAVECLHELLSTCDRYDIFSSYSKGETEDWNLNLIFGCLFYPIRLLSGEAGSRNRFQIRFGDTTYANVTRIHALGYIDAVYSKSSRPLPHKLSLYWQWLPLVVFYWTNIPQLCCFLSLRYFCNVVYLFLCFPHLWCKLHYQRDQVRIKWTTSHFLTNNYGI